MMYWGGKIIENLQGMVVHLCTDLLIYDIHRVDMEEIEEQEAHGPHRSSEKIVQININTYDIIITLIKRGKKPINYFLRIE
mgnify:CR=1 FL=1